MIPADLRARRERLIDDLGIRGSVLLETLDRERGLQESLAALELLSEACDRIHIRAEREKLTTH